MSTTQYTATIRHTAPTPRNKKGTTTATTPSQGTTIITTDTTPSTNTNQHTHHNLTSLNQINTTPADGYLYLDTTDPTTGATTTTKAKAAYADTANEANHTAHADEATHANTADTAHNLDNWTTADQRYLSRQAPDTAAGHITFSQGTTTQGTAKSATYNGNTDFSGQGWAILPDTPNGQTTIVADNLRLRGTLTAHELIIEQIRAICGALGITQACGKIKDVTLGNQSYHITLEGDPEHGYGGFMVNDLVRCQRWDTQRGITGYWARVVYAQGDTIKLLFADFLDPLAQEDGTTTTADTTITPTTITDSQGTPITLATPPHSSPHPPSPTPPSDTPPWQHPPQATTSCSTATPPTSHAKPPSTSTPTDRANPPSTYSQASTHAHSADASPHHSAACPTAKASDCGHATDAYSQPTAKAPNTTASTPTAHSSSDKEPSPTTAKAW